MFHSTVKRAYYKQSLKVHPDRASDEEKENATEKFQTLGKVYSILSDGEKRKIYDETGNKLKKTMFIPYLKQHA